MLQVQADTYVALPDKVRLDLLRVFPNGPMTLRKVRWAIDTRWRSSGAPRSCLASAALAVRATAPAHLRENGD